jgi:hypothetical protein
MSELVLQTAALAFKLQSPETRHNTIRIWLSRTEDNLSHVCTLATAYIGPHNSPTSLRLMKPWL